MRTIIEMVCAVLKLLKGPCQYGLFLLAQSILLICLQTRGAVLSGVLSSVPPGTVINLSAEGNLDWAHWGLDQTNLFNHRDGVIPQISNFSVLGTNSFARFATDSNLFAWTNGTPSLSVSNTAAGALVTGLSNGLPITGPADTRERLLKLYLGATLAQGQI